MARTLSQGLLLTANNGVNKREKFMDKKSPRWGTDFLTVTIFFTLGEQQTTCVHWLARVASLTTPDPEKSYASANGIIRALYDTSYIEPIRLGPSVISLIPEGPETAYERQLAYGWRGLWHAVDCHLAPTIPCIRT